MYTLVLLAGLSAPAELPVLDVAPDTAAIEARFRGRFGDRPRVSPFSRERRFRFGLNFDFSRRRSFDYDPYSRYDDDDYELLRELRRLRRQLNRYR